MRREYVPEPGNRQQTSGPDSNYYAPLSLEDAVRLRGEYGENLQILAGGTDLLVEYYDCLYQVGGLLDLGRIDRLQKIETGPDQVEIGAMVTHSRLEKSSVIRDNFPVLARAAAEVGSPQIRSRGTCGGNIVTASPAGDLLPPLLAYQARFRLVSARGERLVEAGKFFTGPKQNILEPDELLTAIIIPRQQDRTYGSWCKVGRRKALIIASLSLALVVWLDDRGVVQGIRACLGAVAPVPLQIMGLEKLMVGSRLGEVDFERAARQVREEVSPISDLRGTAAYRREVAAEIMINALEEVSGYADNDDG